MRSLSVVKVHDVSEYADYSYILFIPHVEESLHCLVRIVITFVKRVRTLMCTTS